MFSTICLMLRLLWTLLLHCIVAKTVITNIDDEIQEVKVFYFVSNKWGAKADGNQNCSNMLCNWATSDNFHHLKMKYDDTMSPEKRKKKQILTAAVYNVHELYAKNSIRVPNNCDWRTNLTLATSEESSVRYHYLFNRTFNNFDGYSTISPNSSVQRVYQDAYLRPDDFVTKINNFSYLIKAGSFGMSDDISVM